MKQIPDATASLFENQLTDFNGDYAGIVKVLVALDGVTFDGGSVLKQQMIDRGEYWVWMAKDATRLTVRAPGYLPLNVNFRDYESVNVIHPKTTYRLVLTVPISKSVPQNERGQYLIINVIPRDAKVKVDGMTQPNENGFAKAYLPMGNHSYEVSASGYTTVKGDVSIGTHKEEISVSLESLMGELSVECPTPGAQVYINDNLRGTVPWSGSLSSGYYKVEVRLDGYYGQTESVYLSEKENRSVGFQALSAKIGSLNIDYQPYSSDVYIDGEKVGTTPDVFRDLVVGNHEIEIRKDGYAAASLTAVVKENEIVDLFGSLTTSANTVKTVPLSREKKEKSEIFSASSFETFTVRGVLFKMIRVDGGEFEMGATAEQGTDANVDERPTHNVRLNSFMIGETEVTQELWEAVMGKNPSKYKNGKNPVGFVSREDCQRFVEKLQEITGNGFRLPTEAEWEFAARGGNKSKHYKFSGSDNLDEVAWYSDNSGNDPHPVALKQSNELGLYDMSGNVYEWCLDKYGNYSNLSLNNPKGPSKGQLRLSRGGSFGNFFSNCRVSFRNDCPPDARFNYLGLRLAL